MSLEYFRDGVCDGRNATPQETSEMDARWPRVPGQVQWLTSTGLGDLVKKAIDVVTFGVIPQCGGCKERQEWLNKKVPF